LSLIWTWPFPMTNSASDTGRPIASPNAAPHNVLAEGQKSRLREAVEKGFAPLTVGLILATALVMSRAVTTGPTC
jgi:hypothetical protein